jgi:RAQPRD family integrative conjugative element protein
MREDTMKNIVLISMVTIFSVFSQIAWASKEFESDYLTQVLNQLESIKPLIVSAAKEQPKDNRFHFHYFSYKDNSGTKHNGLLEDINEIEKGIKERLNTIPSEPHTFKQISGDYIDTKRS